MACLYFLTRI